MAIYQGDVKVSGNAMMVALPMFFATYQPRKLNNPSWLRADPYSWHSADLYVSAYAHLADNISGITAQTETIAGTTITFYKLSDEIKVVLPDQQTNLDTIYNATGIGYYFVLDTTNRQFKLPRNIYGFTGYRGDVGGYVEPTLPDHTHYLNLNTRTVQTGTNFVNAKQPVTGGDVSGPASATNSIYQEGATVQQPATQAYLYFYVGNTVQNETLADVGEMTEAINDKADLALSNLADAGKEVASSMSFPGDARISLTVPQPQVLITATSDGYMSAGTSAASMQLFVFPPTATSMDDPAMLNIVCAASSAQAARGAVCIRKGQKFSYTTSDNSSLSWLRFCASKGSEQQ